MSSQTNPNPNGRQSTDNTGIVISQPTRKVSFGGEQRFPATGSSSNNSSSSSTSTSSSSTNTTIRARSTSRERGRSVTSTTNSTKLSTNSTNTTMNGQRHRSTSRPRTSSGSSTSSSALLNLDDGEMTTMMVPNDPNIVVRPGPAASSLLHSGNNSLNYNHHGTYTTVPINIAASAILNGNHTTHTQQQSSQYRTSTGSTGSTSQTRTQTRERSLSNGGSSNSSTHPSSSTLHNTKSSSASHSVPNSTASSSSSVVATTATNPADGTVARETLIVVQRELASVRTSLRDMEREKENDRHQYLRMVEDNRKISAQLKQNIVTERTQFTKQIETISNHIKHEQSTFQAERDALQQELNSAITGATEREATLSAALATSQARIEGLLRDAATKDTLAATSGTGVLALQTALHQALKLQNNELIFYKQQNEILQQNSSTFSTVLDNETRATLDNLRTRIHDLESTLESSHSREQELSTMVRTVQNNMNEYQINQQQTLLTLHHQQQDKDDIIQTIANSSKIAMESAKNEVTVGRKVHDTVLHELEQMKEQLQQIQTTQSQRIEALSTELRTIVETSTLTKQALQEQIQQYTKENQNLQHELQQQRNDTLDIQARTSQTEAELRRAVAMANETATEAVRIRDMHDANAVHDIASMAQKLSDVESSSAALQKEMTGIIDDLRAALASAEEAQIKARLAESSRTKQLETNWEAERTVWKQRTDNHEKIIQQKETLLLQLRTESDAEIQRLRQQLVKEQEQHQTDIANLKQEYNDMEKVWSRKVDQRDTRIKELEEEITNLTQRLNHACTIRERLSLDAIPDYVLNNNNANATSNGTNGLSSSMLRTMGTSYVNETRTATLPLSPLSPSTNKFSSSPSPSRDNDNSIDTTNNNVLLSSLNHQIQQVQDTQTSLLSLAQRFGACALSVAWTSQRSLTTDLQTSLVKTYDNLLKSMKASNNPSELVRTQLQLELRSLRTAYNETNTLLYNTKKLFEENKNQTLSKEDEQRQRLEETETSTVRLSTALVTALRTIESITSDLQRERDTLIQKDKQSYTELVNELTNARETIDTLQLSTTNLLADTQRIFANHAVHQKEEIESLQNANKIIRISYETTTKSMENEQKLLQDQYRSLQSLHHQDRTQHQTEIVTLQTQSKAIQNILDHTRSTIQERQSAFTTREQALMNELSRLTTQASVIEADAQMRITASRENFTKALETNIESLNQELARTRDTIPLLVTALDTKGNHYSNQIQTFTNILTTMVKFITENSRIYQYEGQIFTTLISFIHQYAVDLLAKSHNHRIQLQSDIDSLRNKLAGTDANSWSRMSALLSRSQMILQRIGQSIAPNQTGSIASSPEVAVLQALVDRLTAMEQSMNGTNGNDPHQPKAEIQRLTSTLTAERTEADVREQAYLAEMERIRNILDRYRDTALRATTSAEMSANQMIQTITTMMNTLTNSNSSSSISNTIAVPSIATNNNRTVLPGHGLTSPQLMMRNPSQNGRTDVPDPTMLPIPHTTSTGMGNDPRNHNLLFSPDVNDNNNNNNNNNNNSSSSNPFTSTIPTNNKEGNVPSSSPNSTILKNKDFEYILSSPSSLSPIATVPKEEVYSIATVLLQPQQTQQQQQLLSSSSSQPSVPASPIHTISANLLSSSFLMNTTNSPLGTNGSTGYGPYAPSSTVASPQVVTIDLLGDSNFDEGDSTLLSPSPRK